MNGYTFQEDLLKVYIVYLQKYHFFAEILVCRAG